MRIAALILFTIGIWGCSLTVKEVNPVPNIELPSDELNVKLKLDKSIKDEFIIPAKDGTIQVEVTGWRSSLENGFNNGFAEYQSGSEKGDITLKIKKADLRWIAAAVSSDNRARAFRAVIDYKVDMIDTNNEVIKTLIGTATAMEVSTGILEGTVADAVKIMYEDIVVKLFIEKN